MVKINLFGGALFYLRILNLIIGLLLAVAIQASDTGMLGNEGDAALKEPYETLVVTGTRTPRSVLDSPVSVSVIEGELLQQVTQTTVAHALNIIPGVVVKRTHKGGYSVQMQGFSGDRVLVLVDGRRLIAPTGAAVDLDQISAIDIDRIEVVRGAGSVLYGSSAMGGVINIITRESTGNVLNGGAELSRHEDNEVEGSGFSSRLNMRGDVKVGDWLSGLKIQRIEDVGLEYVAGTIAQDASAYTKNFAEAFVSRNINKVHVEYRMKAFSEEKTRGVGRIPSSTHVNYYLSDVEAMQYDLVLKSAPTAENTTVESTLGQDAWQVGARVSTHNELSGESGGLRHSEFVLGQLDAQKSWFLNQYEIVTGLDLNTDSLNQIKETMVGSSEPPELDDESKHSLEGYVQASWRVDKQEVLLGFRVQNDSDFGGHSAVRVGYLNEYMFKSTASVQWRSGLGQSYRVPTLKERFYRFDHSNLGYMVLGNQELTPETALSANSSLTFHLPFRDGPIGLEQFQFEVNFHYSDVNNFIDLSEDLHLLNFYGQGVSVSRYKNIKQAHLKGADLSVKYQHPRWKLKLNYSYLDTKNENNQRLPDRPRHQIKTSLSVNIPRFSMDLLFYTVYESDEYSSVDSLGIEQNHSLDLNFTVSKKVYKDLTWRAGIENFLNDYQKPEHEGYLDLRPVASRNVFLALSYEFN